MGDVLGSPVGVLLTSDDDGASWQERLSFPDGIVTDVVERAAGELFAVTAWNGQIFESTDDGTSWTEVAALAEGVGIASIDHVDERLVIGLQAPGGFTPVLYSDDGMSWISVSGLGAVELAHDVLEASGVLYAGVRGNDATGYVYTSTDLGETWAATSNLGDGEIEGVRSLHSVAGGTLYAGGSTGWGPSGTYVYRLPSGESDWELIGGEVDLANQVRSMAVLNSQLFIATGDVYGNVYRLGINVATDVPGGPDGPGGPEVPPDEGISVQPNPFSKTARLHYTLTRSGTARIEIFDAHGRRVARLDDGSVQPAGRHSVVWTGRNDQGAAAPAGVYYYRLTTKENAEAGSIVLAR